MRGLLKWLVIPAVVLAGLLLSPAVHQADAQAVYGGYYPYSTYYYYPGYSGYYPYYSYYPGYSSWGPQYYWGGPAWRYGYRPGVIVPRVWR